jgi:hypothetical protein
MISKFNKNGYCVIESAINKELAEFIYNYFLLKRNVFLKLKSEKYISPNSPEWGGYNDLQVPNTYSHYADIAMETLLLKCQPVMEKATELKLYPAYSYARIYKKGDVLKKHKDRFSCEISTTMNLGGDKSWPIFLKSKKEKSVKIILKPGDMLIYKGCELEHWRNKFEGDNCAQVFLHYNNVQTPGSIKNRYDTRPMVGLPDFFKNV